MGVFSEYSALISILISAVHCARKKNKNGSSCCLEENAFCIIFKGEYYTFVIIDLIFSAW